MYFLTVSNNNVFKLGIYYIIVYTVVFFTIYSVRDFCKSSHRVNLLRIGIIFNLFYFLMILFLNKNIVNHIYLMAVVYGLEEGFYYSVYNNFESTGIKNKERARFSGMYTSLKSLITIIIPLIFGSVITEAGFKECTIIIIILVALQLICSILFHDVKQKNNTKTDLVKYKAIIKNNRLIKKMYQTWILEGFIYSGAFNSIVTLYIIKVLNNSMDLGIYSSVFAIITCILGIIFAKFLPKKKYPITLLSSGILTVIGLLILMLKTDFVTVIIFNFFQTFSSTLTMLILNNSSLDIANYKEIRKDYKLEYFVFMEKHIFVGRFLGYLLYIVLGVTTSNIITNLILILFGLLVIILNKNTVQVVKMKQDAKL